MRRSKAADAMRIWRVSGKRLPLMFMGRSVNSSLSSGLIEYNERLILWKKEKRSLRYR